MNTEARSGEPVVGAQLRLLQLSSPMLPIGAFAWSQGLEYAVHAGWVANEPAAEAWILGLLRHAHPHLDVPVLARLYRAWQADDETGTRYWNDLLFASRECREFQYEEQQLGNALARLLVELEITDAVPWRLEARCCYATLYALAAVHWDIDLTSAACGYLWSWTENQVTAAIKLVPLGQTAGQRILSHAVTIIPTAVHRGLELSEEDIGYTATLQGMAGALHETLYSRLFRS